MTALSGFAIEAHDISFRYGQHPVLRDVALRIPEGDFAAFIGPNGGGKTTLVKVLLGLLPAEKGSVRLFGKSPAEARGLVGYVPQDTGQNRRFPITALDVVEMGCRAAREEGRPLRNTRARSLAAMERCGVAEKADRLIGQLSGGERQRVFIARALVNAPRLLFLDEPTSSVDPAWQQAVRDLLRELNEEMTIVMVSHDMGVIARSVKSVVCINQTVHYHPSPEITPKMLEEMYHCPVDLIAHGVPHRVFPPHGGSSGGSDA